MASSQGPVGSSIWTSTLTTWPVAGKGSLAVPTISAWLPPTWAGRLKLRVGGTLSRTNGTDWTAPTWSKRSVAWNSRVTAAPSATEVVRDASQGLAPVAVVHVGVPARRNWTCLTPTPVPSLAPPVRVFAPTARTWDDALTLGGRLSTRWLRAVWASSDAPGREGSCAWAVVVTDCKPLGLAASRAVT